MWKSSCRSWLRRPTRGRSTGGFRFSPVNMSQSSHFTGARNEAAVKGVVNSDILDPDKLFRYTSGRWLIDEKYQLEQRFVKFNIDRLCSQAASLFSSATKCVRIGKLEGNFNKAFILTMDDGNEVIAKIPCPNSGTPSLMTASEVATLKFLRTRTSIRVPEVYAWSSDPANPVGAEYIIMEKIRGVTLADRWETMSALERYKVVDRIVAMEKDLSSVNFLAYGSLYLRDSVPHDCHHLPLPPNLDPTGQFCIGPSCSRTMLHGSLKDMSQPDVGPWASFLEFALSIPRRELAVIANSKYDVQQQLNHFSESQSVEEYKHLLEKVLQMLPILSHDPRVLEVASSVIWHIDLHLGNIFVSHEDPTIIEGIIDWQSAQAAPLLTQSRFPDFLRPPKDYDSGTEMPSLPDNFDELDPDEREAATRAHALASRSKYYEMSCLAYNKRVYNAMKLDRRIWEPFTCCQLFSNGGLVPLRNSLVRISQDWNSLGLTGNCPFIFTEEELQRHDKQVVEYQDRLYLWDIAKTQLCTDDSGWVPVERWEMTEKMNKDLFDTYVKTMSDELPREVASKNWPFPPNAASPSFG